MGPSGSGKSTLLHMLMGIEKQTAGEIYVFDKKISGSSALVQDQIRSQIGIMFQQPYLLSELTVLENIMLYAILHRNITDADKSAPTNC